MRPACLPRHPAVAYLLLVRPFMNLNQHIDKLDNLIVKGGAPPAQMRGNIASIREYAEAQTKEIAKLKKQNKKLVAANKEIVAKYEQLAAKHSQLQTAKSKPARPKGKNWV